MLTRSKGRNQPSDIRAVCRFFIQFKSFVADSCKCLLPLSGFFSFPSQLLTDLLPVLQTEPTTSKKSSRPSSFTKRCTAGDCVKSWTGSCLTTAEESRRASAPQISRNGSTPGSPLPQQANFGSFRPCWTERERPALQTNYRASCEGSTPIWASGVRGTRWRQF